MSETSEATKPPPEATKPAESYEWLLSATPGRPRLVAEMDSSGESLAMDETHVYCSTIYRGILRVRKTGGPVGTFARTGEGASYLDVVVDEHAVYWTDLVLGTVNKRSKEGGPIEVLAAGQNRPRGPALDATRVYWANEGDVHVGARGHNGEIRAIDKKGGTPVTLLTEQQAPLGVAVDDESVYYSWHGHSWSNEGKWVFGRVFRVSKAGGAPEELAANTGPVRTLAARAGAVYFKVSLGTNSGEEGPLVRASPGQVTILDPDPLRGSGPLVLGEDSVFYSHFDWRDDRAEIRRVAMDGSSSPRVLARRQYPNATSFGPASIGVDADNVYWVDAWRNTAAKGTMFAAPFKP